MDSRDVQKERTAAEAGWHVSRYNVSAVIPNSQMIAIYNTYRRMCAAYSILGSIS